LTQPPASGRRYGAWVIAGVFAAIVAGVGFAYVMALSGSGPGANDAEQLALGEEVYTDACASCHGAKLEGQPNWKVRQANGRLPAPPHDDTGHTWHHPDQLLFEMTKQGVEAFGPEGYESDMPGFADTLSDDQIRAALAYIKSAWPANIRAKQDSFTQRYQEN
jgi:mono/diheme cytochrome c family protein